MKSFFLIQQKRIRLSSIKMFEFINSNTINIVYNTAEKIDLDQFVFSNEDECKHVGNNLIRITTFSFVCFGHLFVRESVIKKYEPVGTSKIRIIFNTSRYKVLNRIVDLVFDEDRDSLLRTMDEML